MVWLYIECYELDELESLKKQDRPHFRYQLQVQGPPALQTHWLQIGGTPHTHCQAQCLAERLAKLTEGSSLTVRFIIDKTQMSSRWRQRYPRCRQASLGRMGTSITPGGSPGALVSRDPSRARPHPARRADLHAWPLLEVWAYFTLVTLEREINLNIPPKAMP